MIPAADRTGEPEEIAQLRAHAARQAELLNRQDLALQITRMITGQTTLDRLWPLVMDKTCAAVYAERTTMYLLDEQAGELWSKADSDDEGGTIRAPVGEGLAGEAARTDQVINVTDYATDPRSDHVLDQDPTFTAHTMLLVPIHDTADQVIGVLQAINKLPTLGVALADGQHWPPFDADDEEMLTSIAAAAGIAVQNARLLEQTAALTAQTRDMFHSAVDALSRAMDRRNTETAGHSQRVALTAVIMARLLGLPELEVEKLRYAGLLHDIGKVGVPDSVLIKPGSLTAEEFRHMKGHALFTRQILDEVTFLDGFEDIPAIASEHHERLNGSGYPQGRRDISLGGRLLAVADVYDALRARRVYKPERSIEDSLNVLDEDVARGHLDGDLVMLLKECVDEIEAVCAPMRPHTST